MSRVDRVKLAALEIKAKPHPEYDQVLAALRDAADALDALDAVPWYRPIRLELRYRQMMRAYRVLREEMAKRGHDLET